MGSVDRGASGAEEWTETYNVNGTDIKFRVDTGAQANLLAETELPNLGVKPLIKKETKTRLRSYNGEIIPHIGKSNLLKNGNKTYEIEFIIVKGKKASLHLTLLRKLKNQQNGSTHWS